MELKKLIVIEEVENGYTVRSDRNDNRTSIAPNVEEVLKHVIDRLRPDDTVPVERA